jgi:HK97 family phage portal protein
MQIPFLSRWLRSSQDSQAAYDALVTRIFSHGSESSTGVVVNAFTALEHWAVRASVNYISGHFAALPCFPFRRTPATDDAPAGKARVTDGTLFDLVHENADEWTTQTVWAQASMNHILLSKGCFSEIEFNSSGEAVALHLLTPERVRPRWYNIGGDLRLYYEVSPPPGISGSPQLFPDWQIFHVPGLTWNGVDGLPVTETGRDTIGLARAAEISAGHAYKHGGFIGGIVDVPVSVDPVKNPEKAERIKRIYREGHEGLTNHHRVMFNFAGVKYTPVQMDSEKAQLLASRQLSAAEVAGLFGLDPSLIGAAVPGGSSVTYANAESRQRAFYISTLRPLCRLFKQEFQTKCIPVRDKGSVIIDYIFDDLQSTDPETRAKIYMMAQKAGWLTNNEIRAKENLPPLPKADEPEPDGDEPIANTQPATANTESTAAATMPSRALARCKEAITDISTRQLKVWTERIAKQTDDTRPAFVTEQTGKIRSALLPTFHVYAALLDSDETADELVDRHVADLLKGI